MKLNNDLVREMLLQIENDTNGTSNFEVISYVTEQFPDKEPSITIYHMKYLIDAGYLDAQNGYFRDISPIGRDFLNNVRNDQVWLETKKKVAPFGTVALNVLSDVASAILKKTFNL